jgi:hypothetical protein
MSSTSCLRIDWKATLRERARPLFRVFDHGDLRDRHSNCFLQDLDTTLTTGAHTYEASNINLAQ